jgi:serine/threonine-protein kinase RsbW
MANPLPNPRETPRTLDLTSSLGELSRVAPWIGRLAAELEIPDDTRFAIELCLEELLSNVVRHGYASEAGHFIAVRCSPSADKLTFAVEDHAPPFQPVRPADPPPETLNTLAPGSQGLRLLFRFAGAVRYERLADGNRVILEFARPPRSAA